MENGSIEPSRLLPYIGRHSSASSHPSGANLYPYKLVEAPGPYTPEPCLEGPGIPETPGAIMFA